MRISDWSSDVCSSDLTKGRFLKSPAERIATRLTGREVKVTGDFQLYFNPFNIKFLAEGLTVANPDWAEGRHLFSATLIDSSIATLPLLWEERRFTWLRLDGANVPFWGTAKGRQPGTLGKRER